MSTPMNGNGFKDKGRIVIVGASLAGLRAAEALREEGFGGHLTIIGDEPGEPYDRPPLSKQVLKGWVAADHTKLPRLREVDAEWRLGVAATALDRANRDFLLATAAEAAGGIGWCLDTAVVCASGREQFGRPIGSFQAVARSCVDMIAAFQEVSAAARYAAVADAEGAAEAPTAARVAALRASQAYRAVTEAAIHLFGGIGFTSEHDSHLYYRRAWSAERLSGGPHAHRAAARGSGIL